MTVKRTISLIGIIALAVVIGFFAASCGDGGDSGGGGGGGGSAFLGETLTLSGQVYLQKYTETSITYQKFNGDLAIDDYYYGGSGEIKKGMFSYTIGTPNHLDTFDIDQSFNEDNYNDITVSNPNVSGVILSGFSTGDDNYSYLSKSNATGSRNSKGFSVTNESVYYVYVDSEVTISGKGKTGTYNHTEDGMSYSSTYTTKNFSLALKTGWNAVYSKRTGSATITGTVYKVTETEAMSLGNPSLKWILRVDEDED